MNDRTSEEPSAGVPVVVDNDAASRFEAILDGEVVAFADYVDRGDRVELPHTVVDPSMRGRGIGAIIVGHALRSIRASERGVIPTCWYVAQYIDRHPEHADLLTS